MSPLVEHDIYQSFAWDAQKDLKIESLDLTLEASYLEAWAEKIKNGSLMVSFRQGGEVIKPAGSDKTLTLKDLFQQFSIPPWLRDRIPLLFLDDELIIVWGVCQVDSELGKSG